MSINAIVELTQEMPECLKQASAASDAVTSNLHTIRALLKDLDAAIECTIENTDEIAYAQSEANHLMSTTNQDVQAFIQAVVLLCAELTEQLENPSNTQLLRRYLADTKEYIRGLGVSDVI